MLLQRRQNSLGRGGEGTGQWLKRKMAAVGTHTGGDISALCLLVD